MPTNILLKWEADQAQDIHFYNKRDKNGKPVVNFLTHWSGSKYFKFYIVLRLKNPKHSNAECCNGGTESCLIDIFLKSYSSPQFLLWLQDSNSIKPLVLIQGIFWTMYLNLRGYIDYKNEVKEFVSVTPVVKENETFAYWAFRHMLKTSQSIFHLSLNTEYLSLPHLQCCLW